MLPFVLERKSSPDLLASIKDGRYLQQKWRMLSSGLPHRWYLVETAGDGHMSERDKRVGGWRRGQEGGQTRAQGMPPRAPRCSRHPSPFVCKAACGAQLCASRGFAHLGMQSMP